MWRGRAALTLLLTPEQVGERLHLKRRAVLALDLPRVRVGGKKILFREENVELYIRLHVEHKEAGNGDRVQKRQKALGVSGLPSGITYKRYAWRTKAEARQAEADFLSELKRNPPPPKNSFETVCAAYLIDSAPKRSRWRIDSLRSNFNGIIIPYFGATTLFTAVSTDDIERFILHHKKRGVMEKTIWNHKVDISALYNWAIRKGLAHKNPVKDADLSVIKNRRPKKSPLDLNDIDFVAPVLDGYDRAYFNFMRYTGLRMDEANRARWEDIDFDGGWIEVRRTKTEGSADTIPLAPVLKAELEQHRHNYPDSELLFPGRSYQTKGKQIYSRVRFFEKIQQVTARIRYAQTHPELTRIKVIKAVKAEGYKGGVKLTAKDLRDVFGTVVMDNVRNADTARRLMRHTSLQTTTKYMRLVKDRMQEAVKSLGKPATPDMRRLEAGLGGNSGGISRPKTTQNDMLLILAAEGLKARLTRENSSDDKNHHGSGHVGVSRFSCGITSAPKRSMVSKVRPGSMPGQSTMNHMNSAPNSSW
jgi:integrase